MPTRGICQALCQVLATPCREGHGLGPGLAPRQDEGDERVPGSKLEGASGMLGALGCRGAEEGADRA